MCFAISPDFACACIDKRLIDRLPIEMWQTALSYLTVQDIIPHVPRCCRFLQECVWGPWSAGLLWRELGPEELENPRVWRKWHYTLLMLACYHRAPFSHVQVLISAGADVHVRNVDNCTPLHGASIRGNVHIVKALLDVKCDPNVMLKGNRTSLLGASAMGYADVAQALLDAGANVNHADNFGYTALMEAASFGNINVVKILLASRADVHARNRDGQTAQQIAARTNREKNNTCSKLILDFINKSA